MDQMTRADRLRAKASDAIDLASPADREAWLSSSCTKYLQYILMAREEELKELWADGLFTSERESGTIQRNAEALGEVKSLVETKEILRGVLNADRDSGN